MECSESFKAGYAAAMEDALTLVEAMAGPGFRGTGGLILAHIHGRLKEMARARTAAA